ncbi:HNH endonuclease family protein [Streptomyces sp. NPDC001889]
MLAAALTACVPAPAPDAAADQKPAPAGTARAALAELPVKEAGPQTGYDRAARFGSAWLDSTSAPGGKNSCDTRNDILIRDLSDVQFRGDSECVVASGTLEADPYTGQRVRFTRGRGTSGSIDIDHTVALSAAWRTGARQLSQADREALANDPLNLTATSASANRQKGDQDASAWLPGNTSHHCAYVARQIAVKKRYRLWVTGAEKTTMNRVLASCPQQPLPTDSSPGVALAR